MSIFLTETSTHHALLTKQKTFSNKPRLKSNTSKLTSWVNNSDNPILLDENEAPPILQEEDSEEISLDQIPDINSAPGKRRRDDETVFIPSDDDGDEDFQVQERSSKRKKITDAVEHESTDDKKKMALRTAYEGFSIYGRILCLIVKRRGVKKQASDGLTSSSEMLENWVSTQAQNEGVLDDADDG